VFCFQFDGVRHRHQPDAVILRQPGTELDADELKDFLGESLAPFKIPSRIAFVDEQLPRNASGKILKRALRDAYFAPPA